MFTAHCPGHRAEVLLGPRSIESLVNTPDGVVVHWRCACGARGTKTARHGASTPTRRPAPARAVA
jgi:hypothetical protein